LIRSAPGGASGRRLVAAFVFAALAALAAPVVPADADSPALPVDPASADAPAPRTADRAPDILLLTIDTLRPDYLSGEGYDLPTSPVLDSLAAAGCTFDGAVSPIARTTPALASLLTGSYPQRHGLRTLWGELPRGTATLAMALRDAGWTTMAVVTNNVLTRERGLQRGFDLWDERDDSRTAASTVGAAVRALGELPDDRPVFAWVHLIDPHVPYHSAPAIIEAFAPGYDGPYARNFGWQPLPGLPHRELEPFPDDLLPPLLAAFAERSAGNLLVVVTSDHGESLGEHGYHWDHGDYVYEPGLRVPLTVVLPPGHPQAGARRVPERVSLVDLAPTLLDLVGVPPPPALADGFDGRSLAAAFDGDPFPELPTFAESGHAFFPELVRRRVTNDVPGRFRAVTLGGWKLIHTPGAEGALAWELYDLRSDPGETMDLWAADHPRVRALAALLRGWTAEDPGAKTPEVSERDLEALRASRLPISRSHGAARAAATR